MTPRIQIGPAFVDALPAVVDDIARVRGVTAGPDGGRLVDVAAADIPDVPEEHAVGAELAVTANARSRSVAKVLSVGRASFDGGERLVWVQDAVLGVTFEALEDKMRAVQGRVSPGVALALAADVAAALVDAAAAPVGDLARMDLSWRSFTACWDGVARTHLDPGFDYRRMSAITPGLLQGQMWALTPEELMGLPLDERHLVYLIGLAAHRLLAGRHPFPYDGPVFDVVRAVLDGGGRDVLAAARPDIPEAIVSFVDRCMAHTRDTRPDTVAEVIEALGDLRARYDLASEREVAGFLHGLFPEEARRDAEAVEEAAATMLPPAELEGRITLLGFDLDAFAQARPPGAAGPAFEDEATRPDAHLEAWGRDGRAMVLVGGARPFFLDRAPVTQAELARFLDETERPPRPVTAPAQPATGVSTEDAEAFAAWAGKRLPTAEEWGRAVVRDAESAPGDRVLVAGVWEWTATAFGAGRVVRGGAYRDRPGQAAHPGNAAWEDRPADDVGFRCAADADAVGIIRAVVEEQR